MDSDPANAVGGNETVRRAVRTYSAAADHYDRPALGFWDHFGEQTIARLGLRPGDRVLDVCCGADASALAAAAAVGSTGRVVGIDVAERLLALARDKAARDGLHNIEFLLADADADDVPGADFDAVICVFGIFFATDPAAFAVSTLEMSSDFSDNFSSPIQVLPDHAG